MKHFVHRVMGNSVQIQIDGSWSLEHEAVTAARLFTTATNVKHVVVTTGTQNFLGAYDEIEEECTRA